MGPVVVRAFLLAASVDPRQIRPRRRADPGRLRERRQKLLVALARVAPDDAAQATLASSVVPSRPSVVPFSSFAAARHSSTHTNTAWWVSRSMRRRVREIVE